MNTIQLQWSDDYELFSEFNEIIEKTESLFQDTKLNLVNFFFPNFDTISKRPNKNFFESVQYELNNEFKGNSSAFATFLNADTEEGYASMMFYEISNEVIVPREKDYLRFSIYKVDFHSIVNKVFNGIRSVFLLMKKKIIIPMTKATERFIDHVSIAGGELNKMMNGAINYCKKVAVNTALSFATGIKTIKEKVAKAWDYTKEKVSDACDNVKEKANKAWNYTKEKVSKAWDATKNVGKQIGEKIKSGWNKLFGK
jgi:phage-related protein